MNERTGDQIHPGPILRFPEQVTTADSLADAAERLRAVLDVTHALAALDDENELLQLIASSACRCLGYGACVVAVRDDHGIFRYRATSGCTAEEDRLLRALEMSGEAFELLRAAATQLGPVLYIPDGHPVRQHPAVMACTINTDVSTPSVEWRSGDLMLVPLKNKDGEVLGFLNPDDPLDGHLPRGSQITVLEAFAHQAVVALQVVRGRIAERERTQRAEAQRRQLEGLLQASASARASLHLDEVLQGIAEAMAGAGGFGGVVIYLHDQETGLLHARAMVGVSDDDAVRMRDNPVPFTWFKHLMQPEMRISRSYLFDHRIHALPQELDEVLSVPEFPPDWQEGQWHPYDSLTVPLEDRHGRCIGIISVDEPYDRQFPDLPRIQALELFADQCVVAVEQARLYEEMQHLALTDPLTGLPNRALLRDRLQQAIATATRAGTTLALLLMDLDRFKEINDTLGHHYGDSVLHAVGTRLRGVLRASDTAARLGGDEFAAILPQTGADGARVVATAILDALDPPVLVEGHALNIGASIGIALFPEHGTDVAALLRRADVAMYVAKRSHEGCTIYTEEQDQHSPQRLALMTALRQSLAENSLQVYYQPLVELTTKRVTGVEALVRWAPPGRGFIPPDQFIPLAEHTGLIVPLTHWVLEEAIRQCRRWRRDGFDLGLSVNLSARTLHDRHLPGTIEQLLRAYAVPPERLTLEITESTLMADPARALEILTQLNNMGARIAIDDFGIGYSSLGYLKRLPVHEIKLDKSFVLTLGTTANLKDTAIVRSVIAMAQALGLETVAEGVEREASWKMLHALACTTAQGFYISRALPPDQLLTWIEQSPWECWRIPPAVLASG